MKIDFSQPIKNLQGVSLKNEEGKEILLGSVCADALLAQTEEKQDGTKMITAYELAKKVFKGGEQDITAEEITLIKEKGAKSLIPLAYGCMCELLENK